MPTYEFRCANGHTFDEFHKISDAPQTATCPTCGAVGARAISGGAGLVFKGSGFYLTDYGKNAHRTSGASAATNGDAKGDAKGGESKGGESKAGAKSDGGSAAKDGASAASGTSGASGGSSSGGSSGGGASTGSGSTGGSA